MSHQMNRCDSRTHDDTKHVRGHPLAASGVMPHLDARLHCGGVSSSKDGTRAKAYHRRLRMEACKYIVNTLTSPEVGPRSASKRDALLANVHVWDRLAGTLQSTFPLDSIPLSEHVDYGATVLDFGCGEGRLLAKLAGRYARVIGCDTSPRMCHLAEASARNAAVVTLPDPRCLPFPISRFDAVVAVGVLSSIIPGDERRALASRLWRRLPDQGVIVLADFGMSPAPSYLSRYRDAVLETHTIRTAEGLLIHHFSLDELVGLVPPEGKVEVARTVDAHTVHGNPIPGHVAIIRKTH